MRRVYWDGLSLLFCSEIHPVLACLDVRASINDGIVAEFLATEWYSRDETLWNEVNRLVAGHSLSVRRDELRTKRYWSPDLSREYSSYTDTDFVEHYRQLFLNCVRRASRSSTNVAYEVSGGLDSSAIFSMACQMESAGSLPAPGLRAYTLEFSEPSAADELVYSRSVATHLGVAVKQVAATEKPLSWYLDWVRRKREFPPGPTTVMLEGLRKKSTEMGARAILSGVGGDEWTGGGGARYAEVAADGNWNQLLHMLKLDCQDFGVVVGCYRAVRQTAPHLLPHPMVTAYRQLSATNLVMGKSYNRRLLAPALRACLTEKARSL